METVPKPKGQGLAVAGLILSSIFFIPLLPLVGMILGGIALAKAPPGRKTLGVVAVCVGAACLLVIQAPISVIAIQSFKRYIVRAKTVEAKMNLRRIADQVMANHLESGKFPPTTDWVPAGSPCGLPGDKFPANPMLWAAPPWSELQFEIADPHYYQYRLVNSGSEISVQAQGDLNCNKLTSLFERKVDGVRVHPIETQNEFE